MKQKDVCKKLNAIIDQQIILLEQMTSIGEKSLPSVEQNIDLYKLSDEYEILVRKTGTFIAQIKRETEEEIWKAKGV